jgi:putative ABC transport system permease protein
VSGRRDASFRSIHDRAFQALLRLLPQDFRSAYARDMEATFRAERREAGPGLALVPLWLGTALSLLRAALVEHWDVFVRDASYALRSMSRRPLHTTTAVATLGLGLGASVALFSVIDAVLLAPLPYRDADRLVVVHELDGRGEPGRIGYRTFLDLRARAQSVSGLVAGGNSSATLAGDGRDAERVNAARVSASYFHLLGLEPSVGRGFTGSEDRPGPAHRVVVLGHALWQRRFAGDPSVTGRPIAIGGIPYTVVGVMPEVKDDLVAGLFGGAELFVPLGYDPDASFACRTCRHLEVLGRLAPGATTASATRELTGILRGLAVEHPTEYDRPAAEAVRLSTLFLGPVRLTLIVLGCGVVLLLLAACANVSNLLLLRAGERAHEVAVRTAMGITRGRLARQLVTESLILALAGGALGLVPAHVVLRLLSALGPQQVPRFDAASLDVRAVAVGLGLVVLSALVFGLVPLVHLVGRASPEALHGAGRRTDGAASWRLRAALVAGNVAAAAVLLVGSGLLVKSLTRLLAVQPGFDTAHSLTATIDLSGSEYRQQDEARNVAAAVGFFDSVLDRVRGLPGVEAAGAVTTLPLGGDVDGYGLHVVGRFLANPEQAPSADRFVVTPGFFDALRVRALRGRLLDARDGQGAAAVAVVNRRVAREIFAGEPAIGHQICLGGQDAPPRTIVGVVEDVRHHGLDQEPGYQVYVPQAQWQWAETAMTLVIRTSGDPLALAPPLRHIVKDVDPVQPLTQVRSYQDVVAETTGTRRFAALLLALFAGSALAMALVGLYGALGVVVSQKRREIGVRIALGAGGASIRRMVVAQGMKPALAGLGLGFGLSLLGVRTLRSLLYGVHVLDPSTFLSVALTLALCATLACLVPAWRASRTDPAATLRAE